MSQDTASATVKLRGITAKFDAAVKAATPFYPTVCMSTDSTGYDEEYAILGAIPVIREWVGARDFRELAASNWTLVNQLFESSVQIKRTDWDDDRINLYGIPIEQMGKRFGNHPNKLLFELMEAGSSSICFDGQCFYDDDHTWEESGTQSNKVTQTVADITAITASEVKAGFNAAVVKLASFTDSAGELINDDIMTPEQQVAVAANPVLRQALEDALTVKLGSNGGDNVVIARPNIATSARITSTVKMHVFKTDDPVKPFIFQRRSPVQKQIKGIGDIEEKYIKFMTEARYAMGYGAWWNAVEVTFSGS